MESGNARQRWTESRRRKEPSMYDEWLNEEKANQPKAPVQVPETTQTPRRPSGYTAAIGGSFGGTIRAVTPDDLRADLAIVPERGTTSFEQAFLPPGTGVTTTTIVGGPAARGERPSPSSRTSRLRRDREWDVVGNPSSRNGTNGKGMLGRSSSKSNGNHVPSTLLSGREAYTTSRPRTRTLEERRRERSPTTLLGKPRSRMGSVTTSRDLNSPSSPIEGKDYLASVPAVATSPPSAPSISSLGSPVYAPAETAGRRSISPISSHTAESLTSSLPSANARRILHLMKTLNGRMSGNLIFRRGQAHPWSQSYCFIQDDTGALMYEPRGGDGVHKILIPDLRGCKVSLEEEADGGAPFLAVGLPHSTSQVHIKLLNQSDFDSWFAALLCWQPLAPKGHRNHKPHPQPVKVASSPGPPEPPPRISSVRPMSSHNAARDRADSGKSNRRKSVLTSLKEAPVIKIGKMIFWDTNVTYNNSNASKLGQPSSGRPQALRLQSYGSRRWRRISGQLRENGELKLHSDSDNTLISVVQLSQLSRCAIQRLDPTVLENDFCIAIYPQYTSSPANSVSILRPIFLSLENRVLYEVWFVLLRAFTIPQLYGPRVPSSHDAENGDADSNHVLEKMLSHTTTDMFRMERALNIRVVEAKMFPPSSGAASPDSGFSGGHIRGHQQARPEQYGYYVEVLLDNETRGKTMVKYEGLNPLWGESFEFLDLPSVLTSASLVIKRRPPDHVHAREQHESKLVHEAYGLVGDQNGGYSGITFDVACGKVEIYLEELSAANELEKWWSVVNMYNQKVGEVLIKARAEEGVILMRRDYEPLSDLLHRFSNGLTLQVAQMIPSELKRLSDCLLNIFQVSGRVSDWLMALVEEEIDGIHKETPISRLRFSRRVGSTDSSDNGSAHSDRELIVRDLNKNATLEANLLFRGNTLLTKSLDTHMRRVGKEYLEEALGAKIREINEKDPLCEVDPNRVESQTDLDRNWRRLLVFTQDVWKSIINTKQKCPLELRVIFRHVRACAEDRYGDFLRSVSYSSVSGFLFLRFFCPAVLNPKLFGLLKDDTKPRARRTFTLIAKSLQTLGNMASFGTKERWMEPMNAFLTQHRESFKSFIDDVCYVPAPLSAGIYSSSTNSSPIQGVVSAETHLSYTTPMTIMQRLPPTSREGFPSLPFLIDQARAFADLVQLWLEATSVVPASSEISTGRSLQRITDGIKASDGDLLAFHQVCSNLHSRTQECLNRAERAERPNSALSFRWEEIIDQLQSPTASGTGEEDPVDDSFSVVADRIASDPTIVPPTLPPSVEGLVSQLRDADDETDEDAAATRMYDTPPPSGSAAQFDVRHSLDQRPAETTSLGSSFHGSLRKAPPRAYSRNTDSPDQSASASASNVSSAANSDAERTTALPSYEREVRRERREATMQHQDRKIKDKDKDRRKVKTLVPALRKKKEREPPTFG